jgi:CRP-like cAMP-binding protein
MRKVLFIFGQLRDEDVEWLAAAGRRVECAAQEVLIEHGSKIDHLYILLEGQLAIRSLSGMDIALLESGEIIGEMSLVDPAATTVSVNVVVDAVLLAIPFRLLAEKLSSDLAFASRFYFALSIFLADRMRNTTRQLGYGDGKVDPEASGELNENLLETLVDAGARFDRLLKRQVA